MDSKNTKRLVEDLERELAAVIGKLRAQEALVQRRALLEVTIANLRALGGDGSYVPRPSVPLAVSDLMVNPSTDPLWKGIREVLIALNRPAGAPEIMRELQHRGWKFTSNGREFVRTTMMRKLDVFERVEEGSYALKEWPKDKKLQIEIVP